jgi:hypothetical protein
MIYGILLSSLPIVLKIKVTDTNYGSIGRAHQGSIQQNSATIYDNAIGSKALLQQRLEQARFQHPPTSSGLLTLSLDEALYYLDSHHHRVTKVLAPHLVLVPFS